MYEKQAEYYRPLKAFLNDFLEERREDTLEPNVGLGRLFLRAMELIDSNLSKQAFRPERAVNAAYVDSITVAVMRRLAAGDDIDSQKFTAAFGALKADNEFRVATFYTTSAEDSVDTRIDKATEFFAEV